METNDDARIAAGPVSARLTGRLVRDCARYAAAASAEMTEVGICWRAVPLVVELRKFSRWQGRSGAPSGTGSTRRHPRAEAALIAVR